MPETGTIKAIDHERGFAFITRTGRADVFLHVSDVARPLFESLVIGQAVTFGTRATEKGLRAADLCLVSK